MTYSVISITLLARLGSTYKHNRHVAQYCLVSKLTVPPDFYSYRHVIVHRWLLNGVPQLVSLHQHSPSL